MGTEETGLRAITHGLKSYAWCYLTDLCFAHVWCGTPRCSETILHGRLSQMMSGGRRVPTGGPIMKTPEQTSLCKHEIAQNQRMFNGTCITQLSLYQSLKTFVTWPPLLTPLINTSRILLIRVLSVDKVFLKHVEKVTEFYILRSQDGINQ